MHPFRKKNRNHSTKNENKDSQKVQFHPFVRTPLQLLGKDAEVPKFMEIQQVRIINEDTLQQVVFEMNLVKNKN
jgi:hypothetical protein